MSRGVLAWAVVSDPSWPVFIAWSMSSASPPRHSPTITRSGRIRKVALMQSRAVMAPVPSMFAGRVSMRIQCSLASCSSAESSMLTMRSSSWMKLLRTLSSVVLPEPVPPEMTTLSRA